MKILKKIVLLMSLVIVSYFIYIGTYFLAQKYSFSIGNTIAKSINKNKILSLQIGMSEDNVIKLLGNPLSIKKYSKKEYPNYGEFKVLIYATPGLFDGGIEINLIIQDNKLKDISLDNYDVSFYLCNKENCPKIINDKIFNHWIPK